MYIAPALPSTESTPRADSSYPRLVDLASRPRLGGGGSWNEANRRSGAISCPVTSRRRRKLIPLSVAVALMRTAPIIIPALIDTVSETVRRVDFITTSEGVVPVLYFTALRCLFSSILNSEPHASSTIFCYSLRHAIATSVTTDPYLRQDAFARIAVLIVGASTSERDCSGICYVGPMLRRRT